LADPTKAVLLHAALEVITVEVSDEAGNSLATGKDLKRTQESPICRLGIEGLHRGQRTQPAARPAGEGVYAIVEHGDHTHLAYVLELPDLPGEVQKSLNIGEKASYIISVKNPEQPSPEGLGLDESQQADFPKKLQERFRGRRFIKVAPPDFLNYQGAELLLIGAPGDTFEDLGIELEDEDESESTAEIFDDLHLEKSRHPTEPLLKGEWA
jgi:hypothetical protein